MINNSKKLLESDVYEIYTKIESLKRFFSITRDYSIRSNGHLKMLCNLINNLAITDHNLYLRDERLRLNRNSKLKGEKEEETKKTNADT